MGAYIPVCIFLIILGRYLVMRGPDRLSAEENGRAPDVGEKALSWAGMALTAAVGVEVHIMKGDFLSSGEAYWLNIIPLLWLGFTLFRKDIPGDRTATNVGLWTLAPYAAYAFSHKELPESNWLSFCLFGWAFLLSTWRDMRRPD